VGEPESESSAKTSAAAEKPPQVDASEFTEEELKKSEAFKEKGNEFFKGKSFLQFLTLSFTSLQIPRRH
jgi:hypothetical protein